MMRTFRELGPPPPFISVIVPVRNEAAFIRSTLQQLLNQNYDPDRFEVLVADGQSTDATAALVRSLAEHHVNLRLLTNRRRWSSAGRNVALAEAHGDLVVIVDGHCELGNPNYLRDLADAFIRSGADCVGRPQPLDVTGATVLQRAIAAARSSPLGHHPDSFIYSSAEQFVSPQSVAVAYRREVFAQVGNFDENFDACEDVEFNHRLARAGMRCFFTPRVAVRYYPRSTLRRPVQADGALRSGPRSPAAQAPGHLQRYRLSAGRVRGGPAGRPAAGRPDAVAGNGLRGGVAGVRLPRRPGDGVFGAASATCRCCCGCRWCSRPSTSGPASASFKNGRRARASRCEVWPARCSFAAPCGRGTRSQSDFA